MTEMRLAEKRKERTMASRAKRKAKIRRLVQEQDAEKKQMWNTNAWLADLGQKHQQAEIERQESQKQAQIARRSQLRSPQGVWGRVKEFFQRRPG